MDHSQMDHSHMNHGDMDMGHGGMDMGNQCKMNMVFTWNSENLCIVFPGWRITSTMSLLLSLVAIVAIVAGYEALRSASRRYEESVAKRGVQLPRRDAVENNKKAHIVKAAIYSLQSFYAFMIMLLFMTYNGWVMLAVAAGSFVGFAMFGGTTSSTKDNACH